MKRKIVAFTLAFLCLTSMLGSIVVFAVEYETFGYNNGGNTIYIKNNLSSSIYSNHFVTAVAYWNSAGVTNRSIVVNTSSTSVAYNFDFSQSSDPTYVQDDANNVVSWYWYWSQSTTYCTHHKTLAFDIQCNDAKYSSMTSTEKRSWLTHELGHAFGLKDYPSTRKNTSIMSYLTERNVYSTPFSFDVNNANDCWAVHR